MAAAAMQRLLPHGLRDKLKDDGKNDDPRQDSQQDGQMDIDTDEHLQDRADEKRSIAQWENNKRPLDPGEITEPPENKRMGQSSKSLKIDDFKLRKTLGTGTAQAQERGDQMRIYRLCG
jgi:hypothetical protein